MRPVRPVPALALGMLLGAVPASAQTSFFMDGTAFGGSRVFSEGVNPLGNPARFDRSQPQPAVHITFLDGDQRSEDNADVLRDLGIGGPAVPVGPDELRRLSDAPWALRTRAYGMAYLARTGNTSFTHEDHHGFLAFTDRDPAGTTRADVRRSAVDRAAIGIGSTEQGVGLGFSLRLERWKLGVRDQYLHPSGSQLALSGGPGPFDLEGMPKSATAFAVDFGFIYEPVSWLRFGGTLDRLNAKRLWDVHERPQLRLGGQVDLGDRATLGLEADVNAAERMPFPVDQRTAALSLRVAAGRNAVILVGAERKKVGQVANLAFGASLQLRTARFLVGLGFQYGQDRPLKGVTMVVD